MDIFSTFASSASLYAKRFFVHKLQFLPAQSIRRTPPPSSFIKRTEIFDRRAVLKGKHSVDATLIFSIKSCIRALIPPNVFRSNIARNSLTNSSSFSYRDTLHEPDTSLADSCPCVAKLNDESEQHPMVVGAEQSSLNECLPCTDTEDVFCDHASTDPALQTNNSIFALSGTKSIGDCETLPKPKEQTLTCAEDQETTEDGLEFDEDAAGNAEADKELPERQDWKSIHAIPDIAYCKLLLNLLSIPAFGFLDLALDDIEVMFTKRGSFNQCVFLAVKHPKAPSGIARYVIKVPATGTEARWQKGDACNMESEAYIMKYVRGKTSVPVPNVHSYDTTLDNILGAPYMIMDMARGLPATSVWFGDGEEIIGDMDDTTDIPSPDTHRRRVTFLHSLAQHMTVLGKLEFDKIGRPVFENGDFDNHSAGEPVIEESYHWSNPTMANLNTEDALFARGPFLSTKEYYHHKLEESWPISGKKPEDPEDESEDDIAVTNTMKGIRRILDIILACDPFTSSIKAGDSKETFILRHADLDLQNILVDSSGNITSFLDWDGSLTAPRVHGCTSLPVWLSEDWTEYHNVEMDRPYQFFTLDEYRNIYAHAMRNAGSPEAHLVRQSAMYNAIIDAVAENGSVISVIDKLFGEIPALRRADVDGIEERIGKGWPAGEMLLEKAIRDLLKPQGIE